MNEYTVVYMKYMYMYFQAYSVIFLQLLLPCASANSLHRTS